MEASYRKRACTKILTDTLLRGDTTAAKVIRERKNEAKKPSDTTKTSLSTNSQRIKSRMMPYDDNTSTSKSESKVEIIYDDTKEEDQSIIEGEFVIVKVPGKNAKIFRYFTRIDAFKNDEFAGVFFIRC